MSVTSKRFRETRRRLGLKQGDLAKTLGVTQGTISRWENGGYPDISAMVRLAELAGIEDTAKFAMSDEEPIYKKAGVSVLVKGSVEFDRWLEDEYWEAEQEFEFAIPDLPDWDGMHLEGFVVADGSASPRFPKDSIVIAASWKSGVKIRPGDFVIVVEEDSNFLKEVTIAQYVIDARNSSLLIPVSAEDKFKKYRVFGPGAEWVQIAGIVVASFRRERPII